jgi:hypothetical protein
MFISKCQKILEKKRNYLKIHFNFFFCKIKRGFLAKWFFLKAFATSSSFCFWRLCYIKRKKLKRINSFYFSYIKMSFTFYFGARKLYIFLTLEIVKFLLQFIIGFYSTDKRSLWRLMQGQANVFIRRKS